MGQLSLSEAKRLSIKKWEMIVANGGKLEINVLIDSELRELICYCGFCHRHSYNCTPCELNQERFGSTFCLGCKRINHPFMRWNMDNTTENAQAVLDLIKSIPVPENE